MKVTELTYFIMSVTAQPHSFTNSLPGQKS